MPEKIDAIITWVDGRDPAHREKRLRWIDAEADTIHPAAIDNTRFNESGEIYWCIASIIKYASFINKIWIVTDGQSPRLIKEFAQSGICEDKFINIVDHKEIFRGFEDFLPTFNPRSIEAMLWRIPGLADNYIFFNDDMFLNRLQSSESWFCDGYPVIRSRLSKNRKTVLKNKLRAGLRQLLFRGPNSYPDFSRSQELAAETLGMRKAFWTLEHHPHPVRRSTLEQFYVNHLDIWKKQAHFKFRDYRQHSVVSLANHLEILVHGVKARAPSKIAYIDPSSYTSGHESISLIEYSRADSACIQSLDEFHEEARSHIISIMERKFEDYLPSSIRSEILYRSAACLALNAQRAESASVASEGALAEIR